MSREVREVREPYVPPFTRAAAYEARRKREREAQRAAQERRQEEGAGNDCHA